MIWARLVCFFRDRHVPVRSMHGGFICLECRFAAADLEEMGFPDGGFLDPSWRYDRDPVSRR